MSKSTSGPSIARRPPRFLYSHSLLRRLPPEHWVRLAAKAKPKAISKGDALFRRGNASDGCYWLRQGFVKVSVASSYGRERVLAILGHNTTFGEPALFQDAPRAVNAYALTDCEVGLIERSTFRDWLRDNPDAYADLLKVAMMELHLVSEEAVVSGFLSPRGRVAHAMLQLGTTIGQRLPDGRCEIAYAIPHGELASIALVTRESVVRYIGEWRRKRLLHVSAKSTLVFHEATFEAKLVEETRPPPPP